MAVHAVCGMSYDTILWRSSQAENADKHFELIDGELFEMSPPGWEHGTLAGEIYHYFRLFDPERKLGIPTVETGYLPGR